jgi:hypothetical protein
MLFIVTATVLRSCSGLEYDSHSKRPVVHAVEAEDAEQARHILERFYEQQSQPGQPFGDRVLVQDTEAFAPLSLASLTAA